MAPPGGPLGGALSVGRTGGRPGNIASATGTAHAGICRAASEPSSDAVAWPDVSGRAADFGSQAGTAGSIVLHMVGRARSNVSRAADHGVCDPGTGPDGPPAQPGR